MKSKALVTETFPGIRTLLKDKLESVGFELLTTHKVHEVPGVIAQSSHPVGVWIVSLQEGNFGDWAQIVKIKQSHPQLKVMVIASMAEKKTVVHALRAGVADFFEAPAESSRMLDAVLHQLRMIEAAGKGSSPTAPTQKLSVVPASPSVQTDPNQSYTDLKRQWCDAFEKDYLVKLLKKTKGNVSAAARESKLDRSNFLRLLRRHQLKAQAYRADERVDAKPSEQKAA